MQTLQRQSTWWIAAWYLMLVGLVAICVLRARDGDPVVPLVCLAAIAWGVHVFWHAVAIDDGTLLVRHLMFTRSVRLASIVAMHVKFSPARGCWVLELLTDCGRPVLLSGAPGQLHALRAELTRAT